MFERFTERARTVVTDAQQFARESGHGYIGTEHLLVGLTAEPDALAAKTLAYLGIDRDKALKAVHAIVPPSGQEIEGQIPLTPRCKKVLELSLREALSLGHNYIGTEHILLGLVRENEGVAARILLDFDADSEKVRSEIVRALTQGKSTRTTTVAELAPEAKPPAVMPVFTIKAQDVLAQPAVRAYIEVCERLGLFDHARECTAALNEIRRWQDANRDKVKIPHHQHIPAGHEGEMAA